MRIATWNVNSLKARQEAVEGWLARTEPDVLRIQEAKRLHTDTRTWESGARLPARMAWSRAAAPILAAALLLAGCGAGGNPQPATYTDPPPEPPASPLPGAAEADLALRAFGPLIARDGPHLPRR